MGWGNDFIDHDNDGVAELLVASGSTFSAKYDWDKYVRGPNLLEPQPLRLYRNDGEMRFEDATRAAGLDKIVINGRAVALADYDHDGNQDAAIGVNNAGVMLLRGKGGTKNHWLTVTLAGTKSNRQGVGARVTAHVCGRKQVRELAAGSSYLSQAALEAHFGLGAMAQVDALEVRWPTGRTTKLIAVKADQRLNLVEP